MDMLCEAYRDEKGFNRCKQILHEKRCIIDDSMSLHQSLEVALWAEPMCSRGKEMQRKICECSCWSSINNVYGPMMDQWGGYDGLAATKRQVLQNMCKQELVTDFDAFFSETQDRAGAACGHHLHHHRFERRAAWAHAPERNVVTVLGPAYMGASHLLAVVQQIRYVSVDWQCEG
jgi:hypothetical protein